MVKSLFNRMLILASALLVVGFYNSDVVRATEVEMEESKESSGAAIVEVESYSTDAGMIEPGEEFNITFTLHNTSNEVAASGVMMTVQANDGALYPRYGASNQVYVGNIGAGKSKDVTVPVRANSAFKSDIIGVNCSFTYASNGQGSTNTVGVAIPTSGGTAIGIKSAEVASHSIVGGKSLLNIRLVNQTSSIISDAVIKIDGNVSKSSKEIKLDPIHANSNLNTDYYISFTETGVQPLTLTLQYTDNEGKAVEEKIGDYNVTVSKQTEAESEEVSYVKKFAKNGGRILGLVILVACGVVISSYVKKR